MRGWLKEWDMERPGENTLVISESEGNFLLYVACRITCEVERFQRGEQDQARTCAQISLLAERALEILGNRQELEAWLEAATRATELPWVFPASE
jgi:hypothetical protein